MTLTDFLMIAAVLLAPVVAIQVSVFLEKWREKRQRQLFVFRTLMMTRGGSRLAQDHVNALNLIDIEFDGSGRKSKAVRDAWKAYLDLLNTRGMATEAWNLKADDLFIELLYTMAATLGYDIDRTHLRRNSYYPRGYGETETDWQAIRTGIRELLEGKRILPVGTPGAPQGLPTEEDFLQPQLTPAAESAEGGTSGDEEATEGRAARPEGHGG